MLRRTISFLCSQSVSQGSKLLRKCQALDQEIEVANDRLKELRNEVKQEQQKLSTRNKQIHQLRSQLTKDVIKGEEYWKTARNKSQTFRKQSVQNFAKSLVKLSDSLKSVKGFEKDNHELDLKEGFDLTSRLFFNTLEKFKIVSFSPEPNTKFNDKQMIIQSQIKAENEKEKGLVAKVIHPGYIAEGKVIQKAKIQIYN